MRQVASVVIPTKNRGRFVSCAVESALCAKDVGEVIVINDGSTDDTAARLERFGGRITLLHGPLGGAAAARNVGAARARYPLLAFLDDDDEMLPDKVPALAPHFDDPRVGLVHGRIEVMDEAGTPDPRATASHEEFFRRAEALGTSYSALTNRCTMFTSAILVRKEAFEGIGGYDSTLPPPYEDLDLYFRLSFEWRLVYARTTVTRYRIWSGNFDSRTHAEGMLAVSNKHLQLLHSIGLPTTFLNDLRNGDAKTISRKARFGLYRRMAVSSQSLLRTRETRRFLFEAVCSDPGAIDLTMFRLFIASFAPKAILRRRRGNPWPNSIMLER